MAAAPLENISGRPFTALGIVGSAARGEKVELQGSVNGKAFHTISKLAVRSGRVRPTFTPPAGGKWRFRLKAAATPGRDVGGTATTPAMAVYGSNPHGVPASAPHYLVQKISEFHLYYYENGQAAPGVPGRLRQGLHADAGRPLRRLLQDRPARAPRSARWCSGTTAATASTAPTRSTC